MPLRGLYAITDGQLLGRGRLLPYVEAALKGGVRLLQYRDKSQDQTRRRQEAEALKALCRRYAAELIINDDTNLAAQLGVGLHLGQEDGSLAEARALLGPHAIIGATCHASLELAKEAADQGASYVAFGAFFPSRSKPDAKPADVALLERVKSHTQLPVCAIGGIDLDNAPQLLRRGVSLLAVIQALFDAPDSDAVTQRARRFSSLF